ncbi:hypothetical protein JN27_20790 [Massilia sp. BSC265]|nr:hypothetical protein JN27_20790 [Massilia sp. BSC265]
MVHWLEHNPYFPLLMGFPLFYGLGKWIERSSPDIAEDQVNVSVRFRAHIVGLILYKVLLGYLLTRTGTWTSLLVFTGAMRLHFSSWTCTCWKCTSGPIPNAGHLRGAAHP